MASIQAIRRRMRSIEDTARVCRAMELIAASKMKRAQERLVAGRPYSEKISQVVADLAVHPEFGGESYPLLQKREVRKIAIVHITADRGLCGGLNTSLNRLVAGFISGQSVPVTLITVGRKGRAFMLRGGYSIRAEFTGIGDRPTLPETLPISRVVIGDYSSGGVDLVYLAYPRFVSAMAQQPVMELLLPVEPAAATATQMGEYIYEPGPAAVLGELLPRFVEIRVYHAVLELIAGEHSARMIAMRSASDNADDLTRELTVILNKVRQNMINREICDISGGVEALAR